MKFPISLMALALTVCSVSASDFDKVLNTVVSNNMALKYADAENQAAIASLKSENTLDAPEIGFESLWGAKGIGDKRNFSISQGFDWPGVYTARREAIRKSQAAMQYLQESAMIEARQEVRLLLIDIIYAKQRIAATEKICDGLSSLQKTFRKAVDEGNETKLDYNKSVIEKIAAERELKTLRGEYAAMLASLRAMNGGKDVEDLVASVGNVYPEVDLASLRPDVENIRAKDPAIAAMKADAEVQKSLLKVEKRSLLPGFTLGYSHEWEMGDRFNGFSVAVSLPFITGNKKVKASRLQVRASEMQQEMELIRLSAAMSGDYEKALLYRELLDQYEDIMNDNSDFELLKKAFDGGQINFLTYMQELNYFLAARRDFLETLYNYNCALARLQRYN
ncbi:MULTISPECIES: TolC family protein [Duncaniella]|uniref:TolC family protein n=1 Tax=Duncaniella TaxID=2518495 RepID=UPI0010A5568D|nr:MULTISPECIES: TolC family protein [Duncaniella]QCD39858.1 TolC family protein [Duncaniella sp. C9]QCP73506.1 TolC family protein [Duncaniella sp. B8]